MQLLHPWMLLGLLLVPAAALLHVFRAPGRKHKVSYLSLWRNVLERVRPEATERLKRFDWLLILELLIIILLVLGISRPVFWTERPRRHVGFILDTSASMQTVEAHGRSRWEEALERVRSILARLSEEDRVFFLGGSTPIAAWDISPSEAASELERIRLDDGAIDPLKLLEAGLRGAGSAPDPVYFVTDNPPEKAADVLGERLRLVVVGGPSRNVGIVALSGSPGEKDTCEVFVRVKNFSDAVAKRRLVVNDASKTAMRFDVELLPQGAVEKVLDVRLTAKQPVLQLRLAGADDGFALDDEVAAVLRPLWVVAAGKEVNPGYSRLFGGPVFEHTVYLEADRVQPDEVPPEALLIVEGAIPKAFGSVTVVVNPPSGELAGIKIGEEKLLDEPTSPVGVGDEALMRSVRLSELKLGRYRPLRLVPGARAVMRLGGDVVAATTDYLGGKLVVLGFDATGAAWQLRRSFVVFWANVLAEAKKRSRAGGLIHYRTGEVVRLPLGREKAELSAPEGKRGVVADADGWGIVPTFRAGLYKWRTASRSGVFAVNLLSETESDNRPQSVKVNEPKLPIPTSAGKRIPLGPWLCLLAGVLTVVWWHFRR